MQCSNSHAASQVNFHGLRTETSHAHFTRSSDTYGHPGLLLWRHFHILKLFVPSMYQWCPWWHLV